MFRIPKSRIILFVVFSMITAFAYHHWYLPETSGQKDMASSSHLLLSTQVMRILQAGGEVSDQLNAGTKEVYNCQCTVAGFEDPRFRMETPESCGSDRTFMEAHLAKLDPIFREDRSKSPAEFPRACMTFIMRSTYADAEGVNSPVFASCADSTSIPERGSRKPCVTKQYVNAMYNAFGDMTDCLSVPARDYLPKIAIESGFHMNVRGGKPTKIKKADGTDGFEMSGGDTGPFQFVTGSIAYANEDFERMQRQIKNSDRESCKRIAPSISKLKPISSELKHRCGLILPPENPLLSIFYAMIKYDQDSKSLERYMARSVNDIYARMKALGLDETQFDKEKLKQMLLILAYNSGASATVTLLKNYLQAVEKAGRTLNLSDFDIGNETSIYRKINMETQLLRRLPINNDADWARRKLEFETMMAELSKMNLRFKPTATPVVATITNKTEKGDEIISYDTYKLEFTPGDLSFAAYSMLYQSSGNGGYLSKVKASGDAMNKIFKEGVCVPDSYLSL